MLIKYGYANFVAPGLVIYFQRLGEFAAELLNDFGDAGRVSVVLTMIFSESRLGFSEKYQSLEPDFRQQ